MIKKIGAFFLLVLFISCSLDHSNPLDPANSGIEAPSEVTGVQVSLTTENHVNISWNPHPNIEGYYIYRSFSEDGDYEPPVIVGATISSYLDLITINHITPYHAWYELSAYIIVDGDSLEGYRSAPKTWNN